MVASSSWLFVYMAALHIQYNNTAFIVSPHSVNALHWSWQVLHRRKPSTVSITHCIHCRKPSTVNNALHSLLQALHSVNTHCIHRLRKSSAVASPPQSELTASPEYDVENSSFWLKSVYFLKPYTHKVHQNSAK